MRAGQKSACRFKRQEQGRPVFRIFSTTLFIMRPTIFTLLIALKRVYPKAHRLCAHLRLHMLPPRPRQLGQVLPVTLVRHERTSRAVPRKVARLAHRQRRQVLVRLRGSKGFKAVSLFKSGSRSQSVTLVCKVL